jgi:CDP-diacylglycerol---serine O-phosphatidyltransferase
LASFKRNLPNALTLINMSLGVIAILLSVSSSTNADVNLIFIAALLILVAALTDRFDGKVARMLDVASEFGKELDSLADLISFGVAPIIIAWKISFISLGVPGYLISLIFPMAGAYRLARFNTTTFDKYFRGIPITLAGAFLTIDSLYNWYAYVNHKITAIHSIATAVIILALSYLMVCNIKFKKL